MLSLMALGVRKLRLRISRREDGRLVVVAEPDQETRTI